MSLRDGDKFSRGVESLNSSILKIEESHYELRKYLESESYKDSKSNTELIPILEENLPENKRVLLLFSGGKDSCLLAKLLKRSNSVVAVFFGPKESSDRVSKLAKQLRIDDFVPISELASPIEVVRLFKQKPNQSLPIGGNSLLGLSTLGQHGVLREVDTVIHGQGADTISGSMHNQFKHSLKEENISQIRNRISVVQHFTNMVRRTKRIEILTYLFEIEKGFNETTKNFPYLSPRHIQILLGKFYTFIPIDGETINQFQSIWEKRTLSPFHSTSVLNFFMQKSAIFNSGEKKPHIEQALNNLGISGLAFETKGFGLKPLQARVSKKILNYQLREQFWAEFANSSTGVR
jgi:asparagine synthetase B (glutamine-hydrolysing)